MLSIQERLDSYNRLMRHSHSLFEGGDGRLLGFWELRDDCNDGYESAYPAGYLTRIKALFPEKKRPLHIFSEYKPLHVFSAEVSLAAFPGDTVEMDEKLSPTFLDSEQTLENVPVGDYDLILADPPFPSEDEDHYLPTKVKRNRLMRALGGRAKQGTHVVWLDQVLPMYRKAEWRIIGLIGFVKSPHHRFRVCTIFEKI